MNKKAQYSRLIDISKMSNSFSINFEKISDVRELLLKYGDPNLINEFNEPVWFIVMKNNNLYGLEELLNNNVDVNQMNNNNDSWLISCLQYKVPVHILNIGLKKTNKNWYLPNKENIHPFFHENMTVNVANIISMKWWAGLNNWNKLKHNNILPEEYFKKKNKSLSNTFQYWKNRCSFFKQ